MIFNETKLGDVVSFTKGFAFKSKDFQTDGIPIVKVGNLNSGLNDNGDWVYINNSRFKEFEKYKLRKDDAIISTVGSWPSNPASVVGKCCIIPYKYENSLLNQNAVIVRSNSNNLLQSYLGYILLSSKFSKYITSCAQGSASQASITLNDIGKYPLYLPTVKIQKKVVRILKSIDDKISLNNEINNNLLKLCRTYYLDLISKNNIKCSLSELMDYQGGSQPPASEFQYEENGNNIRFVQIRDFENDLHVCYIPRSNKNKLCYKKDILIARYGASLGRICYGLDGAYNVALAKVQPKNDSYKELLRVILESKDFYNYINQVGQRSAQAGFNAGDIAGYTVAIPDENGIKSFNELALHIIDMRMVLLDENRCLSQLRDVLLPKLMNGQIDLDNIEI